MDVMFRGGHLSDSALVKVLVTDERPIHLDRCDICAERSLMLASWLDDIRDIDVETAEAAFPPERLARQREMILRRLAQLEQTARVISFPTVLRHKRSSSDRRVAPKWLGVTAAAGVALGAFTSHVIARWETPGASPSAETVAAPPPGEAPARNASPDAGVPERQEPALSGEVDRPSVPSVEALASLTPRQAKVQLVSLRTSGR
jgi:hypothetical protein